MEPYTLLGAMLVCAGLGAYHAVHQGRWDGESFALIVTALVLWFVLVLTIIDRLV